MYKKIIITSLSLAILTSCQTASDHSSSLHSTNEKKVTVGIFQKEIRKGMTAGQVAEALGSPNIVSSPSSNVETWIYDKISSEVSYSKSKTGVSALLLGTKDFARTFIGGTAGGDYEAEAGAKAQTQRTLTVVITLTQGVVSDFTYHQSSF